MSRSYKHTPRWGNQKYKTAKKWANRIARRSGLREDYPQHGGYRKRFESGAICDSEILGWSFEEFYRNEIRRWHMDRQLCPEKPFPSRAEAKRKYWKKYLKK